MQRRKDNKGRVLKTGESQRKDLIYQYRYSDGSGNRLTIYASDLRELREKEAAIQKDANDGIRYNQGKINVVELLQRYVKLKHGVRYATKVNYNFVINLVRNEDFGQRIISTITQSDAKLWFINLQQNGRGYSTIAAIRGVLRPAFQMACDEDVIRKNPFSFSLSGVVTYDSKKREALTPKEQEIFMNFVKKDSHYKCYYDEFNVLLGTGLRVSELCGLTKADIDFKQRRIKVDKQLYREKGGTYHIDKTKTDSGVRFIPMTDEVFESLHSILESRETPKQELMVDGYAGFILLDKKGMPKVALHIEHNMQWAMKKYNKTQSFPLPKITPHVLRHTFCTNMANAGMSVKDLQYIMGHSDASVTMNVYTHAGFDHAKKSMNEVLKFSSGIKEEESC